MARARLGLGTGDVVGHEGREPVGGVDGAVAVVLGRAADHHTRVELVQLPLDSDRVTAGELSLQADDFAPPHAGVRLEEHSDELVVPPGEEGGPLGDQEDAECVGDHLLGAAIGGTAGALAPPSALRGGVRLDEPLVDGVGEDEVQGRAPGLDAGGRVGGAFLLLPERDVGTENAVKSLVLEDGEQVLLDVASVVLHRGRSQVLGLVPAARVLGEGLLPQ